MMNEVDSYELLSDVKDLNGKGLPFPPKEQKEKSVCIANPWDSLVYSVSFRDTCQSISESFVLANTKNF